MYAIRSYYVVKSRVQVITVKPGFVRTKMTANMPLPGPVTATPLQVANDVFRAYQKQRDVVYTLWMWRYLMLVIRHIPEAIFKRIRITSYNVCYTKLLRSANYAQH